MSDFRKRFGIDVDGLAATRALPEPDGYDAAGAREVGPASAAGKNVDVASRQAALFAQAQQPLKQVGMLAFMMWMSGKQLHLFSIMMTLSGIYQPLSAIVKSKEVFPDDPEGELDTLTPRLLYCLINLGGVGFALYRMAGMGMLPTTAGDWVSSIPAPLFGRHAAGGGVF